MKTTSLKIETEQLLKASKNLKGEKLEDTYI